MTEDTTMGLTRGAAAGDHLPSLASEGIVVGRCGHVFSTRLECTVQTTSLSCFILCCYPPEDEPCMSEKQEGKLNRHKHSLTVPLHFLVTCNSAPFGSHSPFLRDSAASSLPQMTHISISEKHMLIPHPRWPLLLQ